MARDDANDRTVIERVDPLVGTVLNGRIRLEFRLASGGFGAVYRAREVDTSREVAVKVVHGRLATDPAVTARFTREGQTLVQLRSPHTIKAYEFDATPDGTMYIVLELLRGVNLYERFRAHGPLPWPRMVAIARGVCDSLAEAHAIGVVHRDLKPTNIHLEQVGDDEDFVKVLDFGIAKVLQSSSLDSSDLTTAGLMIGTLDYMSPEQMLGGEITGGTDIYTLGIVIYEMITGRRPFAEAETAAAALAATMKTPPPMSAHLLVPGELDRIVACCLERDARRRYTAAELGEALARVAPGELSDRTAIMRPAMGRAVSQDDATTVAVAIGRTSSQAPMTLEPRSPMASLPTLMMPPASPPRIANASQPPSPAYPSGAIATPPPLSFATTTPGAAPPMITTPPPLVAATSLPVPPPDTSQRNTLRGIGAQRPSEPIVDATTVDARPRGYEVDRVVARDAFMRRAVWVVLLAIGALAAVWFLSR